MSRLIDDANGMHRRHGDPAELSPGWLILHRTGAPHGFVTCGVRYWSNPAAPQEGVKSRAPPGPPPPRGAAQFNPQREGKARERCLAASQRGAENAATLCGRLAEDIALFIARCLYDEATSHGR